MKTKIEKVGTSSYIEQGKEYFTEFCITPKVKEFMKKEGTALSCLIQEGWVWYDTQLFEDIDEDGDGTPDKKFGTKFKVIYYGIIEEKNYDQGELTEKGFSEEVREFEEDEIGDGEIGVPSVKNKGKSYNIKYILVKEK